MQQLGLDLGAVEAGAGGDEPLDGGPAGGLGGRDEVLALGGEARRASFLGGVAGTLGTAGEAPGLFELRVVRGGDQAAAPAASLAASARAANVSGSRTAMSARTLRSSSMPAAAMPLMNWL